MVSNFFDLTDDFQDLGPPTKGPPDGKIVAFNKMCHKNKVSLNNRESCRKI